MFLYQFIFVKEQGNRIKNIVIERKNLESIACARGKILCGYLNERRNQIFHLIKSTLILYNRKDSRIKSKNGRHTTGTRTKKKSVFASV